MGKAEDRAASDLLFNILFLDLGASYIHGCVQFMQFYS